jgi:hypothetical protein
MAFASLLEYSLLRNDVNILYSGMMYSYWIDSLSEEEFQRHEREERREARQEMKERKQIIQLQRELEAANLSKTGTGSAHSNKSLHMGIYGMVQTHVGVWTV